MTLAQSTILVVDDEPALALTFCILLRRLGATVFSAANGAQAMVLLQTQLFDLVLIDKLMPVMDGLTLLNTMHQQNFRVPSLFFVSGGEGEDPAVLDRLGVRATLTKPLHPTRLIDEITRALQDIPQCEHPTAA